jgi:hypothetical protein
VTVGGNRTERVGADRTERVGSERNLARGVLLSLLGVLLTLGLVIGAVITQPWQGVTPLRATATASNPTLVPTTLVAGSPTLVPTPLVTASAQPTTPPAPTATSAPPPAPQLSVSPTGEQDITCGAEPFTYPSVIVRNTGGGTLSWSVTASNAQVKVTPLNGALSAGQAQTLSTTQASGGLGTNLTISANGVSAKVSFICIPG